MIDFIYQLLGRTHLHKPEKQLFDLFHKDTDYEFYKDDRGYLAVKLEHE